MPRFLFPLTLLAAGVLLAAVRADDTPGEEAIKEAITILEARKAQAEKKEDKDKIARAIADLGKLLPAAKKDGGEAKADPDLGKLITPALLKKKFAGKAAFNPKTGELTLVYDFAIKDQLKDFDLGDAKPAMAKGVLRVLPLDEIRHFAEFQSVQVTGTCVIENIGDAKGEVYIRTNDEPGSEGCGLWITKGGVYTSIVLAEKKKKLAETAAIKVEQLKGVAQPFSLRVSPGKATLKVGREEISGRTESEAAGRLELLGGLGGLQVKSLVIVGKPSAEWAKGFFKD